MYCITGCCLFVCDAVVGALCSVCICVCVCEVITSCVVFVSVYINL